MTIVFILASLSGFSQAKTPPVKKNAPQATLKSSAADSARARNSYLELRGTVRVLKGEIKDENTPLDSALISIYENDIPFTEIWTNKKGKCGFRLPLDNQFLIEVSKQGFVTKRILVNTKMPPDKKDVYSFSFDIDIFAVVKGLDASILDKPIAKVAYSSPVESFAYDVNYTNRINLELRKMYKNYYMLKKVDEDSTLFKSGPAPTVKEPEIKSGDPKVQTTEK